MRNGDRPTRRSPGVRALASALGLGVCLVASAACHDSPTGPLAGLTTVATVPSLALAGPLPDLPQLASAGSPDSEVRGAVAAWSASWDEPEGESLRLEARETVAAHLAAVLDARGVEEAFRPLLWMETEVGDLAGLPPALVVHLERARRLTLESGEARRSGDLRLAVEKGLEAADHYRAVTPEAVARSLVVRAERRLAEEASLSGSRDAVEPALPEAATAEGEPVGLDAAVLQRAEHLVEGAREALAAGDFTQAIQRAFYGIQVLDGRMVDPEA